MLETCMELALYMHIRRGCTVSVLQDEAQCHNELDDLVAAVQGSLPSSSEQPGFELVYITRSCQPVLSHIGFTTELCITAPAYGF